jgi:hypothetical protein
VIDFINTNFDLQQWLDVGQQGDVLHSFSGEITSEVITDLIEKTENIFTENPAYESLRKITIHVFVESIQNLFHHALSIEEGKPKFGAVYLVYFENSIKVITGNYILKEKIQMITDRINQINSLSKDELKALYKLILNNDEFSEKGGGGLGMIDIARKTGTKMECKFIPVDEKVLFYVLKINII